MSALLHNEGGVSSSGGEFGAVGVRVGDRYFANSAAKFWTALVDEVTALFPQSDRMELKTVDERPLTPGLLEPQRELEREFERLRGVDLRGVVEQALAEAELYGAPPGVHLAVYAGDVQLLDQELPRECIDAEIFPLLVVWLLAWSGCPPAEWNRERVEGRFTALDVRRAASYEVQLTLQTREICEGLLERVVEFFFSVERAAC